MSNLRKILPWKKSKFCSVIFPPNLTNLHGWCEDFPATMTEGKSVDILWLFHHYPNIFTSFKPYKTILSQFSPCFSPFFGPQFFKILLVLYCPIYHIYAQSTLWLVQSQSRSHEGSPIDKPILNWAMNKIPWWIDCWLGDYTTWLW